MEYVDLFQTITVSDLIIWSLAFIFIGGYIHKGLEKYRKAKNTLDDKQEMLDSHEGKIQELAASIDLMSGKIDQLLVSMDNINSLYDEREARRLRREILKFSDAVRNGKRPSKDAFQDIFESNQEYENLIEKTGAKNGYTEHEMLFVSSKYDEMYGTPK